jgi:hypothetical protein
MGVTNLGVALMGIEYENHWFLLLLLFSGPFIDEFIKNTHTRSLYVLEPVLET